MDDFEKKQNIHNWKRLGKLVLAVLGFIAVLVFFVSYSYEEEDAKEDFTMEEDEKELLHELNNNP